MTDPIVRAIEAKDIEALAAVADAMGLFPGEILASMVAEPGDGVWLMAEAAGRPVALSCTCRRISRMVCGTCARWPWRRICTGRGSARILWPRSRPGCGARARG